MNAKKTKPKKAEKTEESETENGAKKIKKKRAEIN